MTYDCCIIWASYMKYGTSSSRIRLKPIVWYVLASCFCIISAFTLNAAWNMYVTYAEVSKYANEAQKKYEDLEQKQKTLTHSLRVLNTPLGKEAELRKKYGLGKPGEGVYVFVEEKKEER